MVSCIEELDRIIAPRLQAFIMAIAGASEQLTNHYDHPLLDLIPRVWRYHLAGTGDPAEAQARTEQTLRLASSWRRGYSPAQGSLSVWLLGLARCVRSFPPRRRSTPASVYEPLPDPALAHVGRLSQLAPLLARLPNQTAEAILLTSFANLTPEETGAVLGQPAAAVTPLVQGGLARIDPSPLGNSDPAGLHDELCGIAGRLAPEPAWMEQLIAAFPISFESSSSQKKSWLPGPAARRLFRLRTGFRWLSRLLPALLLLGGIAYGWWTYQVIEPLPTPSPAPTDEPVISDSLSSAWQAGWLVPPDPIVCQGWQTLFSKAFGQPAELVPLAIYTHPKRPSPEPADKGLGCTITVKASGPDFSNPEAAFASVVELLRQHQVLTGESFGCDSCRSGNYLFGEYWDGNGYTLRQENGKIQGQVSLVWRPTGSSLALCSQDLTCNPPLDEREYALRLTLTTSAAEAALNDFLSAWVEGDRRVLEGLAPDLRLSARSLAAIDALAGIKRTPADVLQLTWAVLSNTGDSLSLTVQGKQVSLLPLPSKAIAPFHMEISRTGSEWQVSRIATHVPFPVSADAVFWADVQGQVVRYSLLDGARQVLTEPQAYVPSYAARQLLDRDPAQVSPDGRWLSLHQPDTGRVKPAALLVDLDNPGQFVKLQGNLRLAWSPDGSKVAYFVVYDAKTVYLLEAPFTGEPVPLATFGENLLSLAWAPDGKRLAALTDRGRMLYTTPYSPTYEQRSLYLVSVPEGAVGELAMLRGYNLDPGALDLRWTKDGHEIWYGLLQAVVDTSTGHVYPLMSSVKGGGDALNRSLLTYGNPNNPYAGRYHVSPDRRWAAWNSAGQTDAGNAQIWVGPVSSNGGRSWMTTIANVGALAWTAESGNLIAGGENNEPGRVIRLDAATGETQVLAEDVFWIGVESDLQARSQARAAEAETVRLETSGTASTWPCQTMKGGAACIPIPPQWALWKWNSPEYQILIAGNVQHASSLGWASLREGDIIIQVIRMSTAAGFGITRDQVAPPNQEGVLWERVMVDGHEAVRVLDPVGLPQLPGQIYWFTPGNVVEVMVMPQSALDDPLVQQILDSIRIESGEQPGSTPEDG